MEYRYCDVPEFLDDAYRALQDNFKNYDEFKSFYDGFQSDEIKDEFLRYPHRIYFCKKWSMACGRSQIKPCNRLF